MNLQDVIKYEWSLILYFITLEKLSIFAEFCKFINFGRNFYYRLLLFTIVLDSLLLTLLRKFQSEVWNQKSVSREAPPKENFKNAYENCQMYKGIETFQVILLLNLKVLG